MKQEFIRTSINGIGVEVSAFTKSRSLPPFLALHGFGSSKEDYYDFMLRPENRNRGFYAFDLPGLAASTIDSPEKANIELLVDLNLKLIDLWGLERFHICGHSMGGLTALYVADKLQDRVLSFTNIEGNVAPEDTFMSAQVINSPAATPEEFFNQFIERTAQVEQYGYAPYVATIRHRISTGIVLPYLQSVYEHSQKPGLLTRFLALPAAKMFVHGEQNSSLSYLPTLKERGVKVLSVPFASHFPMNTNPAFLFDHMSQFLKQTEET